MEETKEYWPVSLAVKKITSDTIVQCIELTKQERKPYVVEYGDRLVIQTTSYATKDMVDLLEEMKNRGMEMPVITGGTPTPPPCPPKGCQ